MAAEVVGRHEELATLEAQRHRRVIRTHTPLDGLPYDDRVTYVCVGRDPRDIALSFEHHMANPDMAAFMAARAAAVALGRHGRLRTAARAAVRGPRPVVLDIGLRRRRCGDGSHPHPILHHLTTFWQLRQNDNVALFHYSDLPADLPGQLRRLSDALEIPLTGARLRQFAAAATFDSMRQRADDLVPDGGNRIWRSNRDFFHRGRNGQWTGLMDADDRRRYYERVASLVPPGPRRLGPQRLVGSRHLYSMTVERDDGPPMARSEAAGGPRRHRRRPRML